MKNLHEITEQALFAFENGAKITNDKGQIIKPDERAGKYQGYLGSIVPKGSCKVFVNSSQFYYSYFSKTPLFFDGLAFEDWLKKL